MNLGNLKKETAPLDN